MALAAEENMQKIRVNCILLIKEAGSFDKAKKSGCQIDGSVLHGAKMSTNLNFVHRSWSLGAVLLHLQLFLFNSISLVLDGQVDHQKYAKKSRNEKWLPFASCEN